MIPGPPTPPGAPAPFGYVVLGLGFLNIVASIGFARFAYTVIIPTMRDGLGLSYTEVGAIGAAGLAGYTLVSPLAGAVAARFGPRRAITASLALVGAGLLGLAAAPAFWAAVVAYFAVQTGSAGANAAGFVIATPWFPARRRGLAAGVVLAGAGAGIALTGTVLPRVLTGSAGWRGAWALVAAGTLVIAGACGLLLRDHAEVARSSPLRPTPGAAAPGRRALVRSRALVTFALLKALFGFQYIIFGTFFAAHLTIAGWPIESVGRLWSAVGVLTIGSSLVGGMLSDRIGRLQALAVLFAAQGAASLLLATAPHGPGLYASILLYGATVMGSPAIVGAFCGDLVGPARASAAVGFVNFFFAIGQMLGPLVAGIAIDATGSLATALLSGAAVAAVGLVGSVIASRFPP